jgi:hypothetical protein
LAGIFRATVALALALATSGCHRSRTPDANLLTSRCTDKQISKGNLARFPAAPSLKPGFGGVVGILADSGGALPHYPIRAERIGTGPLPASATATPDSLGGFVFDALTPGAYRLYARAFSHRPDSTRVEVVAGQVDTVTMMLRVYTCVR